MNQQSDFAQALLNPELAQPDGLTTWNGSNPGVRFAVYRNNVVVSLIDALADSFPVIQELVGEEFFRAMAKVYVQTHPPRTRLLAALGQDFPNFIRSFPPASSLPYLSDVARLEICRAQAYHAEDKPPIAPEVLQQALSEPDQLMTLALVLHPSAHALSSPFAIYSLWAAHQGVLNISDVDPLEPQDILIYRNGLDVDTVEIAPASCVFIRALQGGNSLLSAANSAVESGHVFDLADTAAMLLRLQLITHIHTGGNNHDNTN